MRINNVLSVVYTLKYLKSLLLTPEVSKGSPKPYQKVKKEILQFTLIINIYSLWDMNLHRSYPPCYLLRKAR
jgi:hypothetical protein